MARRKGKYKGYPADQVAELAWQAYTSGNTAEWASNYQSAVNAAKTDPDAATRYVRGVASWIIFARTQLSREFASIVAKYRQQKEQILEQIRARTVAAVAR